MSLPMFENLAKNAELYQSFDRSDHVITWCSDCGNFGIQNALKRALTLQGLTRRDVLFCYDVGCNGNGSDKIEAYTIHGLHGRVISLAAGAAIANSKMKVIASAGDGGTLSEGINHLVHGVRNNYPMVFIHHNNENYGLTTGQPSSTSRKGCKMNSAPDGVAVESLNSLDFVLSLKPSFVARSFSSEPDHMTEMMQLALQHEGFAFLEILQTCPTYNRETPDEWYSQRVVDVNTLKGYDPTDIWMARKVVQDVDDKIAIGLIYKDESRQSFAKVQPHREGRETALTEEVAPVDITKLIDELR